MSFPARPAGAEIADSPATAHDSGAESLPWQIRCGSPGFGLWTAVPEKKHGEEARDPIQLPVRICPRRAGRQVEDRDPLLPQIPLTPVCGAATAAARFERQGAVRAAAGTHRQGTDHETAHGAGARLRGVQPVGPGTLAGQTSRGTL